MPSGLTHRAPGARAHAVTEAASSDQQFVQQRRVCEIGWGDGEVGVGGIGGCGIEQLRLAGVEVDRLGADEHD